MPQKMSYLYVAMRIFGVVKLLISITQILSKPNAVPRISQTSKKPISAYRKTAGVASSKKSLGK
jgi:hypothetical protein